MPSTLTQTSLEVGFVVCVLRRCSSRVSRTGGSENGRKVSWNRMLPIAKIVLMVRPAPIKRILVCSLYFATLRSTDDEITGHARECKCLRRAMHRFTNVQSLSQPHIHEKHQCARERSPSSSRAPGCRTIGTKRCPRDSTTCLGSKGRFHYIRTCYPRFSRCHRHFPVTRFFGSGTGKYNGLIDTTT